MGQCASNCCMICLINGGLKQLLHQGYTRIQERYWIRLNVRLERFGILRLLAIGCSGGGAAASANVVIGDHSEEKQGEYDRAARVYRTNFGYGMKKKRSWDTVLC